MNESEIRIFLQSDLNFSKKSLEKVEIYRELLLEANKHYNLIGKSTESTIWQRHILDSAQLVSLIDFSGNKSLSDLGSGSGFPGIILAIYNQNPKFHVKLYEKSIVKCNFLRKVVKNLSINVNILEGDYKYHKINSEYITARAFKKMDKILHISREIAKKPHKFIILKGKNAQEDLEKSSKDKNFKYRLVNSITDENSKIVIIDA